jgi:hypothetical protein
VDRRRHGTSSRSVSTLFPFIPSFKKSYCNRLLLAYDLRRKKNKTQDQQLKLLKKHQALEERIEKHQDIAEKYLPPSAVDNVPDSSGLDQLDLTVDLGDGYADSDAEDENAPSPSKGSYQPQSPKEPEVKPILLPSIVGRKCKSMKIGELEGIELELRKGQANDALQSIRLAIGEKAFRFRNDLRNANSKQKKTRSWDTIHSISHRIRRNVLVYRQARSAMENLGVPPQILNAEYPELTKDDLKANTTIEKPNARGQRNAKLSWIWTAAGVEIGDSYLKERAWLFLELIFIPLQFFSLPSELDTSQVPP